MKDMTTTKTIPEWVIHVCVIIVYTGFVFAVNHISRPGLAYLHVFLFQLPFYTTFYVNVLCLRLLKAKGLAAGIIAFLASFLVMASVGYIYLYKALPTVGFRLFATSDFRIFLENALLGFVQFSAYAMLYHFIKELFYAREEKQRIEAEKARLENENIQNELEKLQYEYAFLRSQINPHFLHNTLNALFSQAMPYSPELAENIMKLSTMMRYSLECMDFQSDKVIVEKELEHLQSLLDIHNLRFGKSKMVNYSIEGRLEGQMLPPLSLITIVENAFKYGDLKDPAQPLTIKVKLSPGKIFFHCGNKKRSPQPILSSSHIGISNIQSRLDVAFKDKYSIQVQNEKDYYIFELSIEN